MGFGGIPLAEQADYTATSFAPALASLQANTNDRRASLFDQLYSIDNGILDRAIGIRESATDRAFQADQAAKNRASQRSAAAAAAGSQYGSIIKSLEAQIAALGGGEVSNEDSQYQAWLDSQRAPVTDSLSGLANFSPAGNSSNALRNVARSPFGGNR